MCAKKLPQCCVFFEILGSLIKYAQFVDNRRERSALLWDFSLCYKCRERRTTSNCMCWQMLIWSRSTHIWHFKAWRDVVQRDGSGRQQQTDRYGWVSCCQGGFHIKCAGGNLRNPSRPLKKTSEEEEGAPRRMSTSAASKHHTHTVITTNVTLAFEV